jgi:sterol desaturase/sphingolipid hydroxylase (fatty acid hydroxylase superfamily)
MFSWADLLETILKPFALRLSPQGGLHWLSLGWAIAIALVVYQLRETERGRSAGIRDFLAFCFPSRIYASASAKLDFKFLLVNTLVFGAFVAPLLLTSSVSAHALLRVLVETFGIPNAPLARTPFTDVAVTIVVAVAADLGFYISHYLQHRVSFLWEFHKIHHSAEVLQPITAYRSHPVDEAFDATLGGAATGIVLGLTAYMYGQPIDGIMVFQMNALVFLFSIAGSHLRHSHIWLSYGPLDKVFVSPAMHQIHHSRAPEHVDKNLGGMLAIWDRLAGTLYLPRQQEDLPLGLHREEHRDYTTVLRLYILPFIKIFRTSQRMTKWGSM